MLTLPRIRRPVGVELTASRGGEDGDSKAGSFRVIIVFGGRIYKLPVLTEGDLDLFFKRLDISGTLLSQYEFLHAYLIFCQRT